MKDGGANSRHDNAVPRTRHWSRFMRTWAKGSESGDTDTPEAHPFHRRGVLSQGFKGKGQRAKGKGQRTSRTKGQGLFETAGQYFSEWISPLITTCCPLPVFFGFLALRACTTLLSPAKPLLHNTLQSGSLSKSLFCAMFFANPCSAATLISVKRTSVNNRNHLFTNTTSVAGGRMIISSIKGRLDEGLVDPLFSPRGL